MARRFAFLVGDDGRMSCPTFEEYAPPGAILVDKLPPGDYNDFRYIDGQYIYDPLPEPEQPESETPNNEAATWDELAAAIREGVNAV